MPSFNAISRRYTTHHKLLAQEKTRQVDNWFISKKKNYKQELNGVIGRAKRAPHWGVQSRFRVIYIYVHVSVVCQINCVSGITRIKHAHAQSQYWAVKSNQ